MRFPDTSGIGLKPVSAEGTERLVRAAIQWALVNKRKSINLVHKGNIMKYTEGAFKDWGYAVATREFRDEIVTERETWILGNREKDPKLSPEANARLIDPGFDMMSPDQQKDIQKEVEEALKLWPTHGEGKWKSKLLIKDSIADVSLQFVLIRPKDYDVIATLNLNGDYIVRRTCRAGGRHRHCPGREHQLCDGSCHLRGHARHGSQVCRPR